MKIQIRDYRPDDAAGAVDAIRSSFSTLRQSRGGAHPDSDIDKFLLVPDAELIDGLERNTRTMVAVEEGSGEIAGLCSLGFGWHNRITGSAYSKNLFVKEGFQKGRAGVSVGRMIREAVLEKARSMGIRKIYGHSTPGAMRFHAKFGAKFFSEHDHLPRYSSLPMKYYEITLRQSPLNGIPLEGPLFRLERLYGRIIHALTRIKRSALGRARHGG